MKVNQLRTRPFIEIEFKSDDPDIIVLSPWEKESGSVRVFGIEALKALRDEIEELLDKSR